MTRFTSIANSTVGKKVLMAFSGLVMVGWLFIHMVGNLLVFAGQEHFNRYAEFIQSGFGIEPAVLWVLRALMLSMVGIHIWSALGLSARNRAARPQRYEGGRHDAVTNYAAQFMLYGGLTILAFMLFHLAHLTFGLFSADVIQHETFVRGDAYRNLVIGLQNPIVAIFYIVANIALASHLYHGLRSGFQTLGLNDDRWNPIKFQLTVLVPILFLLGNIAIAVACMLGVGSIIEAPNLSWTPPS